jgi:D-tyrosyl-tRNA(Tyr) deacylase
VKAVVARVTEASVEVEGDIVGAIDEPGLLVLLGVHHDDTAAHAHKMAQKLHGLRILDDERSCESTGAPLLVVSQFTLYGDTRKGNRPSFVDAAPPDEAEPLYERVKSALDAQGGRFGAHMDVELVNDGPVTLVVEN